MRACEREAPALAAHQHRLWAPLLRHASETFGATVATTDSIFGVDQPPEVVEGARRWLEAADDWELTGITAASAAAKSLVVSVNVAHGACSIEDAVAAARTEEDWQAEEWGLVEGGHDVDVADMRARIASASTFLRALRSPPALSS